MNKHCINSHLHGNTSVDKLGLIAAFDFNYGQYFTLLTPYIGIAYPIESSMTNVNFIVHDIICYGIIGESVVCVFRRCCDQLKRSRV